MNEWNNLHLEGYLRADGAKGIRNKLLIVYTVECSSFVAKEIARKIGGENIDVIGFDGCCDNDYAVRMLLALIRHPNIGAVLAVGLGCEYIQPETLAKRAEESGRFADWFFIQERGGTLKAIEYGEQGARRMLAQLDSTPTVDMAISDIMIGAECGGSDYTSGLAGNVMVGRVFDRLQELGGTAIFEEIVEAIGLKKQLMDRAADENSRAQLEATYDKALSYCQSVRQYSVSPGNFAGGLSSIEEKSMGAVVKSGTKPIRGVIKVAEKPCGKGLWLLDSTPDPHWMSFGYTNPNDNEGLMDLISCGCQLVFLVTGRGNVVGSAVAPVLKITGNSETFHKMEDDMDFDAGSVLRGEKSVSELEECLLKEVFDVCSGKRTKAEKLGHKEYFIPYKYQDSTADVVKKCR
jgi:altronate dehydratase large subunit